MKLTPYNNLFLDEVSSDTQIQYLKIADCEEYHNHKFEIKRSDYDGLVESVKEVGILQPIIVRPYKGKYEILAGHRRFYAACDAGLETIPAIVRDYDDNAAWLIVSASNFYQSSISEMLPSQIAEVVTDFYNAMKQNKSNKKLLKQLDMVDSRMFDEDTTDNGCGRLTGKVGENFKLSSRSVSRYIKVNSLTGSLKKLLDEGKIPLRAAVDISFVEDSDLQEVIARILESNNMSLTMDTALTIKQIWQNRELDILSLENILLEKSNENGNEFPENRKRTGFKPMKEIYERYFTNGETADEVQDIVAKALEQYFSGNS